ncbi:exodeoxyribonuclease VII small subunit [Oxynema aestuarii]|uniref:Exodeoxyribonuclease 7 small subunit n=1 Tax=Oxynema aestuarii AP17 TaxID=2064643 RepID=A0A6H1U0R2_9CYAN|nr:exodeoxyribonuclease VII small subunit [Oxynema aestuarii]QIZ71603.1 exodeoxyribonuclease VII small subunit [Oxynema aestuarii AP17]
MSAAQPIDHNRPPHESFPPDWSYEETVDKVEEIIEQVESGNLELSEIFDQFAIAVEYLHQCETFLSDKKQKMGLLVETLNDRPLEFEF